MTPGEKATGFIEVPAGVDAAASIPVAVIRGSKPGPVLALVSGLHGTEYASIIALQKLIHSLDPAQISGTVIVLPLVNLPSFRTESSAPEPGGWQEYEPLLSGQARRDANRARIVRRLLTQIPR
jgi:uncharacterized protein